ncbi:hypothetical protein BN1048_01061 [Jeotgalicoccus saudimassiliensis]|uniref:Lipoprotein n=1 Tax=Jeotgalicoccus saudimassiliensis TaxID=1461582 RepID=A0A078M3A7_9STAP|nr:hypothetical protein [Jeotgalicoccus saudimassiliensis]CEA00724.1 hypothetical protein BN1048_01061 [Jeotgalicoccus saudimassiliensis]
MKKTLAALFGSILILSACSDSSEEPASEENGTEEAAEENTAETAGENQGGNSDIASSELIDNAVANSEGISNYVAQQSLNITGADDESTIRTIMTFGGQNEFKLSVNDNGNIVTHYIVEGGHFMYADNEIVETEETVDIKGSDYETIVASLENYPEGEVSELEEGYAITINVKDTSALSGLADEETLKQLEAADSVNGTIQLYFDAEYTFTGSELTADVDSGGEQLAIHSTVDYTNIDDVEMIEKPRDMPEE